MESAAQMKRFIAFDTEDNSAILFKKSPNRGTAYEKVITQIAAMDNCGNSFYSGRNGKADIPKFLRWLEQQSPCVVYAHNLQYDMGALFANNLDGFNVKAQVGSRMIRAQWKGIEFRDSFNIWPMALKKVGAAFGLEKMEMDVMSKAYVFRDVEIVVKAMSFAHKMARKYGVKKFPSTLGSLCVAIWQEMGGENWQDTSEFSRLALFGGRVELFSRGGKGNIFYADVNSLYPAMMLKEFPDASEPFTDLPEFGVAEVELKIPKDYVAPLPVRRADESIYYPLGKMRGVWTCAEIRNAVSNGAKVEKFFSAYGSNRGVAYYSDFVSHFYELRRKSKDEAKRTFYKLLMNNLYGQMAVKGEISMSLNLDEQDEINGFCNGIPYGTKKLCDVKMPLQMHVNYMHAAHVTSYGRIRLQDYLREIPEKSLIYCDTDSVIFFNETDQLPFPISDKLGEMKLEAKSNACRTFGPKAYSFGTEFKAKGVPKRLAKQFLLDGLVSFEQPFKFREAVAFYDSGNSKPLSVWRTVTKARVSDYDKKTLIKGHFFPKENTCANRLEM